jgi:nucleoside-diphosphate kinase
VENTFIILKPDAVQRQLSGQLIARFEQRGLKIVALKLMSVSEDLAKEHYAVHKERPFFNSLISYIISGPVVAMVLQGPNAIKAVRNTVGSTNPVEAAPGSIRGDYGMEIGRNLVHASDGPETAKAEIALWFGEENLLGYEREVDRWILE